MSAPASPAPIAAEAIAGGLYPAMRVASGERWWRPLVHGERAIFAPPSTPAARAAVARAWRDVVTSDIGAYLAHRWAVFRDAIGATDRALWSPVYARSVELPAQAAVVDHHYEPHALQRGLIAATRWLGKTRLFRPYVYLVLAIVLVVVVAWRAARGERAVVLAVLASGLVYELTLFFVAPSPDYRYSHWMIAATLLAGLVLVGRRWWRAGAEGATVRAAGAGAAAGAAAAAS